MTTPPGHLPSLCPSPAAVPPPLGGAPPRACYNCRRRRLRCDRSRPSCLKCLGAGLDCLGYGTVLRWANAPAVRGKLVGQLATAHRRLTARSAALDSAALDPASNRLPIAPALLDPLVGDLGRRARHYVHHFATAVCGDLVSFDQPDRNPFRAIVPLAAQFDYLRAIIVATGAMHLFTRRGDEARPGRPELVDALAAKDRAIRLLRSAVNTLTPATQPMVLAATVFMINLDLIDSGKGAWQAHIEAARTLMSVLDDPAHPLDQGLRSLVDVIAADCLTYRVLGSAISGVALVSWPDHDLAEFFSILKRAEAYSYHCCPPEILQILLAASGLCGDAASPGRIESALALFYQAGSLDVHAWVHSIRGLSAQDDLDARVSIALAHRATACLYILLAVPEAAPSPAAVDALVQEVLRHLAAVPTNHVLLKGTVWPTFMVGAQTDDPRQRAWVMERMQAVWVSNKLLCPWGYVRTAMKMMQQLWKARDRDPAGAAGNWLLELKRMREKCLIV